MDQRYGTEVWNRGMERILQGGMERGGGTGVWNGCGPGACSGPPILTCTHIVIYIIHPVEVFKHPLSVRSRWTPKTRRAAVLAILPAGGHERTCRGTKTPKNYRFNQIQSWKMRLKMILTSFLQIFQSNTEADQEKRAMFTRQNLLDTCGFH